MEPQLSYYYEVPESGNVYEVYDLKKLPAILDVEDAVEQIDMTALNNYMLGNFFDNDLGKTVKEDTALHRLSLAYENLHEIPKIIVDELGDSIEILDISNNKIDDLDFLSQLKKLSSLICDHNNVTSRTELPHMPQLELLWMNNCKISELYPWCRKLRNSCPNLRYLSLMGNPAVPSFIKGSGYYDYVQYRLFMISLFPRLVHLDEEKVTQDERQESKRLYQKEIFDFFIPKTSTYFRKTTEKINEFLSSTPAQFKEVQTNSIV